MVDISRLSTAERQVLLLLAQGHTVKSVAAELGLTEGAVNERLREARRKTGASSSRELARRLTHSGSQENWPQENWDEKIGMATAALDGETRGLRHGVRRGWPAFMGVIAIIILASAVSALTALAFANRTVQPVAASTPPRVVETYPAAGAKVPAGKLAIRVTFDQAMLPGSYSYITRDPARTPACDGKPVQSADGKSFTMTCVVQAGRAYVLGFNDAQHRNFASTSGLPAMPAVLWFSTR